jgi:1,6-anhydro-N-acetylmuramate kinase
MRRVVGCMTGTSIDGLDAALVEIEGQGLQMRAKVVRCVSRDLGEAGTSLRRLAEQQPVTAGDIAAATHAFAMVHAAAIQELLGSEPCDLVCVHGQTVYHKPPHSWQLMQPAPIVAAVGCPVVYDLRQADLAAGGQGAPITPIADWVLFRGESDILSAIVNLGGFCNVTVLPRISDSAASPSDHTSRIAALDVCACNQLLDTIARRLMNAPFDADGQRAASGQVQTAALEDLSGVLAAQASSRRSLGTGDEVGDWISRYRAHVSPEDLAATACEAIAQAIAEQLMKHDLVNEVLLAGGGVHNKSLVAAIRSCCSAKVDLTDSRGVPAAYREAACFAVLGALCQDRVPITLPAVTGVKKAPLSGAWVYP